MCVSLCGSLKMNPATFFMQELNSRNPKKVGSKPKRRERVYKRAAKAQRDLFRKRKDSGAGD